MKLISRIALILALSALLSSCGDSSTAEDHAVAARAYMDNKDYAAALIEFRNAAHKAPDNSEVRYELARLSLATGDFTSAEKEISRAEQLGLDKAIAQPILIESLFRLQRYDEVTQVGETFEEGMPKYQRAKSAALVGQSYIALEEYAKAEKSMLFALSVDPASVEAMIGMSILSAIKSRADKAMDWALKARDADPSSDRAWSAVGDVESSMGDSDAAYKSYSEAITRANYITLDVAKRARMEIETARYTEAESSISQLRQSPYAEYWYLDHLSGLLHFSASRYQDAANAFDASLIAVPGYVESLLYAALSHIQLGHIEQASALAERVDRELPRSLKAKRLKGLVLLEKGDFDGAQEVLLAIEQDDVKNVDLIRLLGMLQLYKGNTREALKYSSKLLAIAPNSTQTKEFQMLTSLIAGEDLSTYVPDLSGSKEAYNREVLLAISDFKEGRAAAARERAQKLAKDYPAALDPLQIVAATYLAIGDWEAGRKATHKILEVFPGNKDALMNLAKLELITGNNERVGKTLAELMERYSGDSDVFLFAYDMNFRLGDTKTALQTLEAGLSTVENKADLSRALISSYFANKDYQRVIGTANDIDDDQLGLSPEIVEMIGLSYASRGNFSLAIKSLNRFMKLQAPTSRSYSNYGDVLAKAADTGGAIAAYKSAISLDPDDLGIRIKLINLLGQTGQIEQADTILEEAVIRFGTIPDLVASEGWLALVKKDFGHAEQKFRESLENQSTAKNTILLARALCYQGKPEQCLGVLDEWLRTHPDDLDVLLHKAGSFLGQENAEKALESYQAILKFYPQHVPTLNNVAWLSRESDIQYALATAEKAYTLASDDPFVLDTLGNLKVLSGEYEEGLSLLRKAEQRAPSDRQIQLHLADTLLKGLKPREAKRVLDKIIVSAPESEEARQAEILLKTL